MKRVLLLIVTNVAVLLVLSVVARILGLDRVLDQQGGLDFQALLAFCAVFGFGGALISLAMSKWVAKRSTGARVIGADTRDPTEAWLYETVQRQSRQAGIGMPEVAVYDSPDMNAFATGARRDSALVAVSTGLLQRMNRREVEAVLGHEISHVANGDMVTLTLIQGVVNTFVLFLSRVIGHVVDRAVFRSERDDGHGPGFFITSMVAQLVLGVLASMIVAWFSRQREFRADSGGASLAGRDGMINALERLKSAHEPSALPDSMKAFGIAGGGGIARLFMTHPPLDERIAALRGGGGPLQSG